MSFKFYVDIDIKVDPVVCLKDINRRTGFESLTDLDVDSSGFT